jgi:hypothetical protein
VIAVNIPIYNVFVLSSQKEKCDVFRITGVDRFLGSNCTCGKVKPIP